MVAEMYTILFQLSALKQKLGGIVVLYYYETNPICNKINGLGNHLIKCPVYYTFSKNVHSASML